MLQQKINGRMKGNGVKGLRGWDFLSDVATGKDYFVHRLDVIGELPKKGDFVTFSVGSYAGREKAVNVRVIKPTDKALGILSGTDGEAGRQS